MLNVAIYSKEVSLFLDEIHLTSMHVSNLDMSLKIPLWRESGSCIHNHSWTVIYTSLLLWIVARCDTYITVLGFVFKNNETSVE